MVGVLTYNGPELIADILRDWCRRQGTHTAYIEKGSLWENSYVESFNGRLCSECPNIEEFASLIKARVVLEDWRTEYNTHWQHRFLGVLTPVAHTAQLAQQPTTPHNEWTHIRVPVTRMPQLRTMSVSGGNLG